MAIPALASKFGFAMLGTYHDRVGEDYSDPTPAATTRTVWCKDAARNYRCTITSEANATYAAGQSRYPVWGRLFGASGNVGYSGFGDDARLNKFYKSGPSYSFGFAGFQLGIDLYRQPSGDGVRDVAGLFIGAGRIDSDVQRVYGGKAGSTSMDGYSFGGYWTRKGASGWYIDAVAQGTWYDQVTAESVLGEKLNSSGWGFAASLESGYPFALGAGWAIEPQAQLIYQHVAIDGGGDSFGQIHIEGTDTLYGRLGARLTKNWSMENGNRVTTWARANVWHALGADAKTTFSGPLGFNSVVLRTDLGGTWGQVGVGVSGQVTQNASIFAAADYNFGFDSGKDHSISGRLGAKFTW